MTQETTPEAPVKKKKRPRELAVVNQAGCTGCEVCIEFCPVDCILTVPGAAHTQHQKLVEIDLDICIGCKLCVKYCPWETIEMIPGDQAYGVAQSWTTRSVLGDAEWIIDSGAEVIESGPLPLPGTK
jgi:formate hydrogenlyase subunit 6/NADH:ubiquinone oxidoreductase subunit I